MEKFGAARLNLTGQWPRNPGFQRINRSQVVYPWVERDASGCRKYGSGYGATEASSDTWLHHCDHVQYEQFAPKHAPLCSGRDTRQAYSLRGTLPLLPRLPALGATEGHQVELVVSIEPRRNWVPVPWVDRAATGCTPDWFVVLSPLLSAMPRYVLWHQPSRGYVVGVVSIVCSRSPQSVDSGASAVRSVPVPASGACWSVSSGDTSIVPSAATTTSQPSSVNET